MAAITAVTFDLWQTLLLDRPEVGRIRTQARLEGARQALLEGGHPFDLERIEEAYRAGVRQCQEIRESGLDIAFNEQVKIFVNSLSPDLSTEIPKAIFQKIASTYSDSFLKHPAEPHPAGVDVLRAVREMGLRVGLISNTGMTPGVLFRQFLEEHGMLGYFDVLTFSDEVGYSKPSPEIFALTLEKLGATPSQTVHVGDHIFNDVAAAKACGFKTVWIEGFYKRPNDTDQATEADISVSRLEDVVSAIRQITMIARE